MPGNAKVVVVTDSTAYLPPALVAEHGLTVVPLQVVVGGRSRAEGTEVTTDEVATALRERRPVTTSRPAPAVFAQTYRELAAAGAGAVVSVHLSGDLSGTVDAARTAAAEVSDVVEVRVVDARHLGMALGFAAIAAGRAAAAGAEVAEVVERARRTAYAASAWFYVDTLEYLRRGGRIGPAAAMLGSALSVKPLLHVVDGRLEPFDRVRTASRALARLEEVVVEAAGSLAVDIAVQHVAAPEAAGQLADRLRARLPGIRALVVGEVGAVVGAHVGPGMLGVVVSPVPAA
jgi:DegV family protein with EDD domain